MSDLVTLYSPESCYKIQRKFYITEQLNKDTEKNIYVSDTENHYLILILFIIGGLFVQGVYVRGGGVLLS